MPYESDGKGNSTIKDEKTMSLDLVDTAVDSSHSLNELVVNIVTPIVSGVINSLVGSVFKKK